MRSIVAAGKALTLVLSGLFTMLYQTIFIAVNKGRGSLVYPRLYHAFLTRVLGIKVIVEGNIDPGPNIVYMSNHLSYMDVQVLGGLLKGCFVAKKEIERWPFFGYLGKMGRTVYVSRNPLHAGRETKAMLDRLDNGLPLIIFPEGTSSNGTSILPFKSSFFEIFLNKDLKIQPLTINVLEIDGKPVDNDAIRDRYAWHGDMTLLPHLWPFFKGKGAVVKVCFQEPLLSLDYSDRKTLCGDCRQAVVKGLIAQNNKVIYQDTARVAETAAA